MSGLRRVARGGTRHSAGQHMSIRILIDMNLSPDWVAFLEATGWPAIHWSTQGNPRAADSEILEWARSNNYVVLTHDLDFSALLALTHATGPSTIQVRSQDVLPDYLGPIVVAALKQHETDLLTGAIVVVDQAQSRARVLPI